MPAGCVCALFFCKKGHRKGVAPRPCYLSSDLLLAPQSPFYGRISGSQWNQVYPCLIFFLRAFFAPSGQQRCGQEFSCVGFVGTGDFSGFLRTEFSVLARKKHFRARRSTRQKPRPVCGFLLFFRQTPVFLHRVFRFLVVSFSFSLFLLFSCSSSFCSLLFFFACFFYDGRWISSFRMGASHHFAGGRIG